MQVRAAALEERGGNNHQPWAVESFTTRRSVYFTSSVKVTGLAQKLGQLEAVNREFQSKYWANLQLLDQPCTLMHANVRQHRLHAPL